MGMLCLLQPVSLEKGSLKNEGLPHMKTLSLRWCSYSGGSPGEEEMSSFCLEKQMHGLSCVLESGTRFLL